MLGPTEKPAASLELRLELTVQGPKPATASPGYLVQKPVIDMTGFFYSFPPLSPLRSKIAIKNTHNINALSDCYFFVTSTLRTVPVSPKNVIDYIYRLTQSQ